MKNNNYIISYRVTDNPNYDYEEEFSTVSSAIKRAMYILKMYDIDGTVTVSDHVGELVEVS